MYLQLYYDKINKAVRPHFCAYSMEGGDTMQDTLLELLVAPITVGVIVSLFTYWLNDDDD